MEFYGNQLMDAFGSVSSGNSDQEDGDLRKGPWTAEEDAMLVNYVNVHGEGRWNNVAHYSGLKRTGKSCRLRWLNYLRPDVRRGNITLKEQLLILELHSRWGNRWSKIAKYLPGRTDNEIKNYWRTRVQKQAKQLKCDVNSQQFRDTMRYVWMPRLAERIRASSSESTDIPSTDDVVGAVDPSKYSSTNHIPPYTKDYEFTNHTLPYTNGYKSQHTDANLIPEASGISSDSSDIQVSSMSGITDCAYEYDMSGNNYWGDNMQSGMGLMPDNQTGHMGWSGLSSLDMPGDEHTSDWLGGEDSLDDLLNEENLWLLKQQLSEGDMDF